MCDSKEVVETIGNKCKATTFYEASPQDDSKASTIVVDKEYEYRYSLFQDVYVVAQNWRGKWVVKEDVISGFVMTNTPSYHTANNGFVVPDMVFDSFTDAVDKAEKLNYYRKYR